MEARVWKRRQSQQITGTRIADCSHRTPLLQGFRRARITLAVTVTGLQPKHRGTSREPFAVRARRVGASLECSVVSQTALRIY